MRIREIDIDWALPCDRVRIATMHPSVALSGTGPFCWSGGAKARQIERIRRFMDGASSPHSGIARAHFTVVPEYGLPGVEGIELVDARLRSEHWPAETFLIAGVDGLTREEFREICRESENPEMSNIVEDPARRLWVNCSLNWFKASSGEVRRWVQPKLEGALPEALAPHELMARGEEVLLFQARYSGDEEVKFRFFSLICFDWIAGFGIGQDGIKGVLAELERQVQQKPFYLDFVFVPQHNPEPNHRQFLEYARDFFEDATLARNVSRNYAVLVMCNSAGDDSPGSVRDHGFSSFLYGARDRIPACPPTFSIYTKPSRNQGEALGRCLDALLRENGQCYHTTILRPPRFISLNAGNRVLPIAESLVFALDECDDPRLTGAVSAVTKWTGDRLDGSVSLLNDEPTHELYGDVATSHEEVVARLRVVEPRVLSDIIETCCCSIRNPEKVVRDRPDLLNVDSWEDAEKQAFEKLVDIVTALNLDNAFVLPGEDCFHGLLDDEGRRIRFAVVTGDTHRQCFEHVKGRPSPRGSLVCVVSFSLRGIPFNERFKAITDAEDKPDGKGVKFLDPDSIYVRIGGSSVLGEVSQATSSLGFATALRRFIQPQ